MSGAHDRAREAAAKLVQALRYETSGGGHAGNITDYQEPIETIAQYLGVDMDEDKHEHNWSEWSYATNPAGLRYCLDEDCGEVEAD